MPSEADSFLGVAPESPSPRGFTSTQAELAGKLVRRYKDSYTQAHAVVAIGSVIKFITVILCIAIVAIGFFIGSGSQGQSSFNMTVFGIALGIACIVGIPFYILGILVAAQGQTQLATLDTAVNSSRHLGNQDVADILSKRFSL